MIEPTESNADRLLRALRSIGFGTASLITPQELVANEITVFNDRVRIDVQTLTPGIAFAQAWEHRETMSYAGQEFLVAARRDIVASKRASGRERDLEDARILELPPGRHRRGARPPQAPGPRVPVPS